MRKIDLNKLDYEQRREVRAQAERYFSREFNAVSMSLIEKAYGEGWISENVVATEKMKASYWRENTDEGKQATEDYCRSREIAEPKTLILESEILDYLTENHEDAITEAWSESDHYPMWGTLFEAKESGMYADKADELDDIGIGLIASGEDTNEMLFIAGAGYDFYDAHWIPLFSEVLDWIEVPAVKKEAKNV